MRIIAGQYRGRRLQTPPSSRIRPTTDRVRETLFNILSHTYVEDFAHERVLDLFAGTGAMGLEAISRGAEIAYFVEKDPQSARLIATNITHLEAQNSAHLLRQDATRLPLAPMRFTLAFMDPPYQQNLVLPTLEALHKGDWLMPEALIIVEEHAREALTLTPPYHLLDRRLFGTTQLLFLSYSGQK